MCGLVYQQAAARGGSAPADPESSLDGDAASFCDHAVACLDVSWVGNCPSVACERSFGAWLRLVPHSISWALPGAL